MARHLHSNWANWKAGRGTRPSCECPQCEWECKWVDVCKDKMCKCCVQGKPELKLSPEAQNEQWLQNSAKRAGVSVDELRMLLVKEKGVQIVDVAGTTRQVTKLDKAPVEFVKKPTSGNERAVGKDVVNIQRPSTRASLQTIYSNDGVKGWKRQKWFRDWLKSEGG